MYTGVGEREWERRKGERRRERENNDKSQLLGSGTGGPGYKSLTFVDLIMASHLCYLTLLSFDIFLTSKRS